MIPPSPVTAHHRSSPITAHHRSSPVTAHHHPSPSPPPPQAALERACDLEFANLNRDLTLALDTILNHKIAIETKIRATEESAMRCLEEVESTEVVV